MSTSRPGHIALDAGHERFFDQVVAAGAAPSQTIGSQDRLAEAWAGAHAAEFRGIVDMLERPVLQIGCDARR